METTCEPRGSEILEGFDDVLRLLVRHLAPPEGLSFAAMMCLTTLDRRGPTRLTSLGAIEGISQPSVSQLVRRLEGQGLVVRGGDPHDGRVSMIAITSAGRELVSDHLVARRARLSDLLQALPPASSDALQSAMDVALPILRELIETARDSSGAGSSSSGAASSS